MTTAKRGAGPQPDPPERSEKAALPSFEEELAMVENAVELLEHGNLPLEQSLREYERGLRALKSCYEILGRAQKRIEVLGLETGAPAPWKAASSDPALRDVIEHIEREGELPEA